MPGWVPSTIVKTKNIVPVFFKFCFVKFVGPCPNILLMLLVVLCGPGFRTGSLIFLTRSKELDL
jgi:hypothetical protein